MQLIRLLYCLSVLMQPAAIEASSAVPEIRGDCPSRLRADLEAFASEYSVSNLSDEQIVAMNNMLEFFQIRCARLGKQDPDVKPLVKIVSEFRKIVDQLARQAAERRKNDVKPYVFGAISGPSVREGGHSEQGIKYLTSEVEEFIKQYRTQKRQPKSDCDEYVISSRTFFRRTIELSIDTATRQTKSRRTKNVALVSPTGGIVYDNYSSSENLRWALSVARIAQYFESRVGGSSAPWIEWEGKIQRIAAEHEIALD